MNLFDRIIKRLADKRAIGEGNTSWLNELYPSSIAGPSVTPSSSLGHSAVWAAVRLLSGTVAGLPLIVYERKDRGKQRASTNPAYYLLHTKPNPYTTAFKMRQALLAHQLLWGNAYAEIEWTDRGPKALWLLPPWKVKPEISDDWKMVRYVVDLPGNAKKILRSDQVIHLANLSMNGLEGMSCIRAGSEAVGLGMAADEFASRFFSNGANVGGVAEHPTKMTDEAAKRLQQSLNDKYQGLGNSHRLLLLEEGMKYQRVGIPPNDAQMIETRKFQVAEIGRFFGISQLHKLGDLEHATFTNIEHQAIEFVTDTIQPLLINMEQELNSKLFEETPYFAEHLIEGLLRGDTKTRYESYAVGRQWGWLSANDIRELENQNPIENGDMYLVPMNMIPADQVTEVVEDVRSETRSIEDRTLPAKNRAKIAKSFRVAMAAAAKDFIDRETKNVLKAAKKNLRDVQLFQDWMNDYYKSYPDYIRQKLRPVMRTLANAINEMAAEEIMSKPGDVNDFVEKHITRYIWNHVDSSKGQLNALIQNALDNALDPYDEIEKRMDEWNERRPDKIANNETVSLSNAVALFAFTSAGREYVRWVAVGAESCPYCQEMDGRRTMVSQPFASTNSDIKSDDGRMQLYTPTTHPPLHQGCECSLIAD